MIIQVIVDDNIKTDFILIILGTFIQIFSNRSKILLEYNCFTMLSVKFLLYNKVNRYMYTYIPCFWISFPFRSPQSTEQSSLCYTAGSHQLSILYIVVCICQSTSPTSSHLHLSPLVSICSHFPHQSCFCLTLFQIPHICINI